MSASNESINASNGMRVGKVTVHLGDICDSDAHCVVNPVSSSIRERYSTGIFKKAGGNMQTELIRLLDNCGRFLEHGDCVSTYPLSLPCRRILHLAVPKPGSHAFRKESTYTCGIKNCVNNVLTACYENGWTSIAFPNLWQTTQTQCTALTELAVAELILGCVREFTEVHCDFSILFFVKTHREFHTYSKAVNHMMKGDAPAPRGYLPSKGPGRPASMAEPAGSLHIPKKTAPLLSVRILGARLSQDRSGSFALYDIETKCGKVTSTVSRRFRSFVRLRDMLSESSDSAVKQLVNSQKFPVKKLWGSRDLQVICERSERLNEFLQVLACSQAEDPYTDLTGVCLDGHSKQMDVLRTFLGVKLDSQEWTSEIQGRWFEHSVWAENKRVGKSKGSKNRNRGLSAGKGGLADVTNTMVGAGF
jgi:O-acetyl-ADP-ribose deacetylase (regulator of RNase III)